MSPAVDAPQPFKPGERPLIPGSPATPQHSVERRAAYIGIGLFLALTGGFQNGLLLANLPQIQGSYGLSAVEGGWLVAAYSMTNACASILLFKLRQQFGIARFVRLSIGWLLVVSTVQLFDTTYSIEVLARCVSGVVGSCLVPLSLFYLMQGLSPKLRLKGLVIAVGLPQIAAPLARAISPALLLDGNIEKLFLFQFGLAVVSLGLVGLVPLPQGERTKVFDRVDLISFPLFAGGIALLCAFLVQGRIQWWTTQWLGLVLAGAILLVGIALMIEHRRRRPLFNTRWMSGRAIVALGLTAATVRVLLSEQSVGSAGLLSLVGMGSDQLTTYYAVVTGASLAALLLSVWYIDPTDLQRPVMLALALIATASFIDVGAGALTRPVQLYFSQALLAFAAIYFLGPLMMEGVIRALASGPSNIVSFIAIFGLSQSVGGLAGAAALSAFQTIQAKQHLSALGERLQLTDPLVSNEIASSIRAGASTVGDAAVLQARAASSLVQRASLEANIGAFNDIFLVLGSAAALFFAVVGVSWLLNRRRGIVPLSADLAALQKLMGPQR